jgi:hypothetical protein
MAMGDDTGNTVSSELYQKIRRFSAHPQGVAA